MATSKLPEDITSRRLACVNGDNAVKLLYQVARFLTNPGSVGKSEAGEVLAQLALYLDGVILPADNHIVRGIKLRFKKRPIKI